MVVTFGATFLGVIASFLLWFGGQWWLKRKRDQRVVKHIAREIREEIAVNIDLLAKFAKGVTIMIEEKNLPFFLPYPMNLSVYHYLTSSGELRLLDVSKQRHILTAGRLSERFNKFIDNTELLLAMLLGKPYFVETSIYRLERLVEQAQDQVKALNEILGKL